ncbi:FBD-associated F-box protein At3g52670-like [Rutidosis leptorrhynchoides]|uniref:FBD-associated F-box protein At3g52670-like n=1 Tax=Rutidosis leptorrhynchoides TaxID=125765 RepID=UPI003A99EF43
MDVITSCVKYEPINLPLPRQNRSVKAAKLPVTNTKVNNKRTRDEEGIKPADVDNAKSVRTEHSSSDVDVFTNLPECLKLHILSFLDVKYAVRTSGLSRTWKSLWTSIPTVNLDCDGGFKRLNIFDKFVHKSLSLRDPVMKLDRLTFTRRGISSAKILKEVFNYTLSHNVKELELWIDTSRNGSWPDCLKNSSNSLTSLKLRSDVNVYCPLLEPQSGPFKNLAILHLEGTIISDSQPFSRFPVLEKLTLIDCPINETGDHNLNIHALKLLELKVSSREWINCLELITPNLKSFEFQARNFSELKALHGLPVLQTVAIDYPNIGLHINKKKTFEYLLCLFSGV